MINRIPSQNRFLQTGKGDTSGNVWSSRNLDFEISEGKLNLSQGVIGITQSDDSSTHPQSTPQAFEKFNGAFYCIADDDDGETRAFSTVDVLSPFGIDNNSPDFDGAPRQTDMKAFNNRLYVASGNEMERKSGTTWTNVSTSLASGRKLLENYAGRLYVVDDDLTVISMNADETFNTTSFTLDLDTNGTSQEHITCMRAVSSGLWVGTFNGNGGRARMYFWDGETEDTPEAYYEIPTMGVMSIVIKNDRPYIICTDGIMYTFNGSFFEEVARMDIDSRLLYRFNNFTVNDKFIHPNGMTTVRDEILFVITTRAEDSTDTTPIKSPSGVYAYHPDYGIYHKHTLSSQDASTTQYDYGQVELPEVGAIFPLYDDLLLDSKEKQSDFLVGYSYNEDTSTEIAVVGVQQQRGLQQDLIRTGVFVTPEFYSEEARQSWMKVFLRIKPMDNDTDKIVLKYRTRKYTAFEADITWVDTTSFTSTDANFANVAVGYEFEGLQGDGAGFLAHITAISESGGTYTVTLDETITNATTRTAKCRIDNWVKSIEVTKDDQPEDIPALTVGTVSAKIQYKLYMVGDIELEEFISVSKPDAFIA